MSESHESRIVRLEEQFKFLVSDAKEAKEARKSQYLSIESMAKNIIVLSNDMTEVKGKLTEQSPTIEEFITIKHKVIGAGKFGGWLWAVGALVITFVATSREAILQWLSR